MSLLSVNNVQEYSGNRTKEDIISFIKSNQ